MSYGCLRLIPPSLPLAIPQKPSMTLSGHTPQHLSVPPQYHPALCRHATADGAAMSNSSMF
jgi:hypothetical protein